MCNKALFCLLYLTTSLSLMLSPDCASGDGLYERSRGGDSPIVGLSTPPSFFRDSAESAMNPFFFVQKRIRWAQQVLPDLTAWLYPQVIGKVDPKVEQFLKALNAYVHASKPLLLFSNEQGRFQPELSNLEKKSLDESGLVVKFDPTTSQSHRVAITLLKPSPIIFNNNALLSIGATSTKWLDLKTIFGLLVHEYGHHLGYSDTDDRVLDQLGQQFAQYFMLDSNVLNSVGELDIPNIELSYLNYEQGPISNKTTATSRLVISDGKSEVSLSDLAEITVPNILGYDHLTVMMFRNITWDDFNSKNGELSFSVATIFASNRSDGSLPPNNAALLYGLLSFKVSLSKLPGQLNWQYTGAPVSVRLSGLFGADPILQDYRGRVDKVTELGSSVKDEVESHQFQADITLEKDFLFTESYVAVWKPERRQDFVFEATEFYTDAVQIETLGAAKYRVNFDVRFPAGACQSQMDIKEIGLGVKDQLRFLFLKPPRRMSIKCLAPAQQTQISLVSAKVGTAKNLDSRTFVDVTPAVPVTGEVMNRVPKTGTVYKLVFEVKSVGTRYISKAILSANALVRGLPTRILLNLLGWVNEYSPVVQNTFATLPNGNLMITAYLDPRLMPANFTEFSMSFLKTTDQYANETILEVSRTNGVQ